jgi:hypothetical protein
MNENAEQRRNKISDLSCEVLMRFKYFHVRFSFTNCVIFHHMSSAALGTEVMSGGCFSLVSVFSLTPGGPILKTNERHLEL